MKLTGAGRATVNGDPALMDVYRAHVRQTIGELCAPTTDVSEDGDPAHGQVIAIVATLAVHDCRGGSEIARVGPWLGGVAYCCGRCGQTIIVRQEQGTGWSPSG